MALPPKPRDRRDFGVAVICALEVEAHAVELQFDHCWDRDGDEYGKAKGDLNSYRTGVVGNHNVVLAYMAGMGKVHAANVAKGCRLSFPNIRLALIVGVCGGVPGTVEEGIFLGDIIISDDILSYDFGKLYPGGFQPRTTVPRSKADSEVPAFLRKLRGPEGRDSLLQMTEKFHGELQKRRTDYLCPGQRSDRLFEPTYYHRHSDTASCKRCQQNKLCPKAQSTVCEDLGCDLKKLVVRSRPSIEGFRIHFGTIASGDMVMKSGEDRDKIAKKNKVIAFEMEGAGIDGVMPFLVIKGVCDYADSHKNKIWQQYSAGAAASCMKAFLRHWAALDPLEDRCRQQAECSPSFQRPNREPVLDITPMSARSDEGYYSPHNPGPSDGSNENLEQVLQHIDTKFKCATKLLKDYRAYLPRDKALRAIFKTQRHIVSEHKKSLLSARSTAIEGLVDLFTTACLDVARGIRKKLDIIISLIERLPSNTKAIIQDGDAVDTLNNHVEGLISQIKIFTSITAEQQENQSWQRPRLVKSGQSCRKFEDFGNIQRAANSLYKAIQAACGAHPIHNVRISLQPDLDGTTTRVRFNFALIQDPKSPANAVWIDVESSIKFPAQYPLWNSISSPRGSTSAALKRSFTSFQFDLQPPSSQSLCQPNTSRQLLNFSRERNFCTVVRKMSRHRTSHECIGLLGETASCTHLAYLADQADINYTATSLADKISESRRDITKKLSQYERVRLAKCIATAVLYYHSTPWLNTAWRSEDVHFVRSKDEVSEQTQSIFAYMTGSVTTECEPPRPDYYDLVQNPVLFGLGVMLLELALEAPLNDLIQPIDRRKGVPSDYFELFVARKLVEISGGHISRSYKQIIKRCLNCDFGHENSLTSPALQQAFYNDVITVLDDLEEQFRELQLD